MFRRPHCQAYRWRRQHRRLPRLPRNLYRVLALAVFWLTVAPVATYLVSGQAGGPNQSTTPVATSNPSPVPLTPTAPQTANTTATTTQPAGLPGNSPRWAGATLATTAPSGLAGLVAPRDLSFSAVTTSPQGSMPAITSQTVQLSTPNSARPGDCLPGDAWSWGQFNVDVNADGSPDQVHFVLSIFSSVGSVDSVDISSDDSSFCETAGGSLTNGTTGTDDDERITSSGTLVRLGPSYAFQLVFGSTGSYLDGEMHLEEEVLVFGSTGSYPSGVSYYASITAATWYVATVTGTDLDGDGAAGDTFYAALSDTDSDGMFDQVDLSIGDNVFGEGNPGDGIVDYSATDNTNDERVTGSANVKLGANTFYLSFDATPGAAPAVAMTLSAAWYQGVFTIDLDADGLADDTLRFVLSDTDGDGRYDTMDLSTDGDAFGEGTLSGQVPLQAGANDDERLGMSNAGGSAIVRLGDYYSFTVAFVNNPSAGGNVASIRSETWYAGSFTIDSDGDEAANDTVYFVLGDTDSDGRYDTLDIETDDGPGSPATLGEGSLSGQSPRQTGVNDDERLGTGSGGGNAGGSATVRLGLHMFTVAFDNNPAAPARTDDARLTAQWYAGTLDGLAFVQISPTSNGLYTVLELDANRSGAYESSEVLATTPTNLSMGNAHSTLTWRGNPSLASSVTLSRSAGGQAVAPNANPSSLLNSSPSAAPSASGILFQQAEQAQREADAQDGQESTQPIPPQAVEPSPARVTRDINNQPLAGDEVVVTLDPNLPDPERRLRQIAFATGATFLGSVSATRTYQLQFQVADLTALDRVIARLEGFTGVASASHHYLLDELARTPNDSRYPSWGEAAGEGWDLRAMRAPEAWDTTTGSPSVRIAVIDADFDRNHEDLRDNVTSLSAPKRTKAGGHGTHVSGTICARGDNAVGVAGVVWDCSLSLYDFGGASPVKAQEAMIAAVQSGARIINMSLQWVDNNQCGTVGTPATSKKVQEVNNILKGGLDYARRERRDVLWVFAAGNECRDTRYASPASLVSKYPENIIVVSSIGPAGDLSYFSNYGDLVTVVAPGEDILSTLPSNDYGLLSGTSMATPHVSGLAALIMSRRPALSAAQVKQCITGSAGPSSRNHSYKLVNAAEALRCGETTAPPSPQRVYGGG
ncbi:MAG: S8 family serine peptidase [Chloroflexi bacterium]|nr:S8 family serine peptidase [Chloroflexota bacterium]